MTFNSFDSIHFVFFVLTHQILIDFVVVDNFVLLMVDDNLLHEHVDNLIVDVHVV